MNRNVNSIKKQHSQRGCKKRLSPKLPCLLGTQAGGFAWNFRALTWASPWGESLSINPRLSTIVVTDSAAGQCQGLINPGVQASSSPAAAGDWGAVKWLSRSKGLLWSLMSPACSPEPTKRWEKGISSTKLSSTFMPRPKYTCTHLTHTIIKKLIKQDEKGVGDFLLFG